MLKGIAKASTSVGKLVEKIPVISKGQADEALIAAGDKLDEINAGKVRKQMSSLIEHQSNAIRPFIENNILIDCMPSLGKLMPLRT